MDTNSLVTPPQADEVEVSVFGPGYGESVLVHLGLNEWLVVDSCLEPNLKTPAPLNYLRKIGVEVSRAVKLIVASHWHDDHVSGLAKVFRRCRSADFVCSEALTSEEFLALARAVGSRSMMESSGVDELYRILAILQKRLEGRAASKGPEWAIANRLLLRGTGSVPYEVYSLSPSSGSITLALAQISELLPRARERKKRLVALRPNHVAVVLWIQVGGVMVLLGSDLEETSDSRTGWSVILGSTTRPSGRASVFKIPHHGSANADQPGVWSEMLIQKPFVVLAPFNQGNVSLPTKRDAERICSRTERAYSTAMLRKRTIRRPSAVERTIKEVVKSIKLTSGSSGQVRLRTRAVGASKEEWKVELFGDALPLNQLAKML